MKKLIRISALLLAAALLTGCSGSTIFSNYIEVEKMKLIRSVGVDGTDDSVEVTASSGDGLREGPPEIFSKKAGSIASALDEFKEALVGGKIYFAHTEHLLIGEDTAREGITPFLDYVERTSEMRLDTNIFIVRDGTAKDLLTRCAGERTSATGMLDYMRTDIRRLGRGFVFTCEDTAASLAIRGCALVMAVRAEDNMELSENAPEKMVVPAGFAVLKDGRLIGFLDTEETEGASLLLEKVDHEDVPLMDGGVTVSVTGEQVKVTPLFADGQLERIDVTLEMRANVEEIGNGVQISSADVREVLERELSEFCAERVTKAVAAARRFGVDVLEIGERAERYAAEDFSRMDGEWEDIFLAVPINVHVRSTLRRTYDIEDPVKTDGREDEQWK